MRNFLHYSDSDATALRTENQKILQNFSESDIKKMIFRYLDEQKISHNDLYKIDDMFLHIFGTVPEKTAGLVEYFYNIVSKHILLPNYCENDAEKMYHETLEIVKRTENSVKKHMESYENDGFFSVIFPDSEQIYREFEYFGNMEARVMPLGGVFQSVVIENDLGRALMADISVRTNHEFVIKSGEKSQTETLPLIPAKKFYSAVKKSLGLPRWSNFGEGENYFFINDIPVRIIVQEKGCEEDYEWLGYATMRILIGAISDSDCVADLEEKLHFLFDIVEKIVNTVAQESGYNHRRRRLLFTESYFEEDDFGKEAIFAKNFDEKKSIALDEKRVNLTEKVFLDDVGGNATAKMEVQKIINSLKFSEIMQEWWAKPVSGMIFEWPSGTGKTLLAKAIATEVNAEVYTIKLTDIASSAYVNESANNVKKLFADIRQKASENQKIIIILDELDALFGKRDNQHSSSEDKKVVNAFLTEMSGFEDLQNVIFIGTTNLVENIDPAVCRSGRLGKVITVGKPDISALEQIFTIHMRKIGNRSKKMKTLLENVNTTEIAKMAHLHQLTGADVEEIVRILAEEKAHEAVSGKIDISVTEWDFFRIIRSLKKPNTVRGMWFLSPL